MEDEIRKAIKLLSENNYAVIKMSKGMIKDSAECDALNGDKECFGCSCSGCVR